MKIKLSVIVPVYNVEKFIAKCVISLFDQNLENMEYIFVNDCSPDNSIDILRTIICKYPKLQDNIVIVDHVVNGGQASARKSALKIARGEYIIHLDSDDWIDNDLYKLMYDLGKRQDSCIICCGIKFIYKDRYEILNFSSSTNAFLDLEKLQFGLLYSSLCNKMVKRDLYFKNDIYPFEGVNMWEDVGIMSRLRYYAKSVAFLKGDHYYNYNKTNEYSIVSIPKEVNIMQQIKCAQLLAEFYIEKNESNLDVVVSFLKFVSKSDYLYHEKVRNISKWQNIYYETHIDIFRFNTLPYNMKVIAWLASKDFLFLLKIALFFKEILIKVKK